MINTDYVMLMSFINEDTIMSVHLLMMHSLLQRYAHDAKSKING